MLVMTQPEIEGSDANDLKLQSSDSQEDSKDDAQSDCDCDWNDWLCLTALEFWGSAPDTAVEKRYSTV